MKILVCFLLLFNLSLNAHPLDLGVAKIELNKDELSLQLDLNKQLVEDILSQKDSPLTQESLQSQQDKAFKEIVGEQSLASASALCTWQKAKVSLEGENIRVSTNAKCSNPILEMEFSPQVLKWSNLPNSFQLVLNIKSGETETVSTLTASNKTLHFQLSRPESSFKDFMLMGIDHIGAGPSEWKSDDGLHLPDGIDHILFLMALLLAGGGGINILKTITGFTLGHSVTLIIASLNILRLPGRFVESMIALSIAYVAIESVVFKKKKSRWQEASLFGLMHGFGFAGALAELELTGGALVSALVGFNVGVELGQILITLCLLPLLYLIQKNQTFAKYFVPVCSLLIFTAASYWFVQRAFF